jgi:lysophospholipase L1-like esterase
MSNTLFKTVISLIVFVLTIFSVSLFSLNSEDKKPLPIHYSGRVVIGELDNKPTYTYSWPGVYFEAAFIGTEVELKLNDSNNIFNIIVDGQAPIVLTRPGKTTYSINDLTEGKHHIRLEKRTETQFGTGTFEGFFISGNGQAITPEKPERKIEFIGDSAVVGYGIRSPKRECGEEEVFAFTDSQITYAALTAKAFEADYQINALSGFGVVRNYNGAFAENTFLSLYPYALNDKGALYQSDWSPNIIVIGLGGNDFATPLNPDEKWKTREALQDDYVNNYKDFILSFRTKHPNAHFILLSYAVVGDELGSQVTRVIKELKQKGIGDIGLVTIKPVELAACHWHPSESDHKKSAEILTNYIKANPELWN